MNRTDAAKVLAVFSSCYRQNVDETTAELWYSTTLQNCDAEIGSEVARRIVEADDWFPTPARFNALRKNVERGREAPYRAVDAAPTTQTERDRIHQIITDTRHKLRGGTK
jgi:hypothetical protein